jgi:hypothetical protein
MEQLKDLDSLNLREKKKYDGVPEDREPKPFCCLSDASEAEVYYAVLEGGTVAERATLRKARAFTLSLFDKKGFEVFRLEKRADFWGSKLEIFDASRVLLGSVRGPRDHFQALDAKKQVLYDIEGASAHPELFSIRRGKVTLGKISKRPTRIAEEGVSRNDHFGIVFPLAAELSEKAVLLGALFLIDLLF